ncbi:MAG: hypothetical protein ACFFFH_15810 [Candidatus Thorarchaeota archaeon]
MVSRVMVVGIIVLILGGFLFVLFTLLFPILGMSIYPFYITTGSQNRSNETVSSNSRDTIDLTPNSPGIPKSPLPLPLIGGVQIKASFYLQGTGGDWDCNIVLVYQTDQDSIPVPNTDISYSGSRGEQKLFNIYTSLNSAAASADYDLYVEIDNTGNNRIALLVSRVDITYTLLAQVIPALLAIAGIAVTIFGVVQGRKPSAPKAKPAPGGWEPTLQWGGGAAKQPKMAIKSKTAKPQKVKKVVKKAAPAGGAQQPCKFCGKPVPASAFFCPHCYGKLR